MAKKTASADKVEKTEDVVLEVPESVEELPEVPEIPAEEPAARTDEDATVADHGYDTADEFVAGENVGGIDLERIKRLLDNIENDLKAVKQLVSGTMPPRVDHALRVASAPVGFMSHGHDAGIDGTFDGEKMVDAEGKTYQVPPNYASKSKLVEGDPLKLYITRDGKYVYKQLGPVERTTVPGTLRLEGSHYVIDADDGNSYNVLTACVTYYISLYSLEPGGRVMAMIPADRQAKWAVLDNVL
ncbi:MAG TPA: hypothetical protein VLA04_05045 [Verrucomicrobiae bacterium]|nr:hypothetical protein [Verrucomicrobiae bacterium]